MNPFLSVIMPVYNGEKFIAAALRSVREQFRDGIEVVFVDDGSTDRTLEIVRDFAQVIPMRILTPGRIGGWPATTNIGLREARGEWACFLHHDDFWLPGRIARLWGEMESAKGAFILHNAVFVGPDGKRIGPWTCPFSEGIVPPEQFVERLLIQNFIAIPSPTFRRKAVLESGGLDEASWVCADWDIWLRLGALGPVRFIAESLSAYRIHPASMTAARKRLPNEWGQQLTTVLDRHLKNWNHQGWRSTSVERVARASIAVNAALSAGFHGEPFRPSAALLELFALGPAGWHRYLRDSRIIERVRARLRVRRLLRP
jgi:GT2 family glycosyltransferase